MSSSLGSQQQLPAGMMDIWAGILAERAAQYGRVQTSVPYAEQTVPPAVDLPIRTTRS
jgi:hypothetical protein